MQARLPSRGAAGAKHLLQRISHSTQQEAEDNAQLLYSTQALQMWLLVACQEPQGLRDKPGKRVDFYHTCYCLSGLAVCQHHAKMTLGPRANNTLCETDVCLNVQPSKLRDALLFYAEQDAAGNMQAP